MNMESGELSELSPEEIKATRRVGKETKLARSLNEVYMEIPWWEKTTTMDKDGTEKVLTEKEVDKKRAEYAYTILDQAGDYFPRMKPDQVTVCQNQWKKKLLLYLSERNEGSKIYGAEQNLRMMAEVLLVRSDQQWAFSQGVPITILSRYLKESWENGRKQQLIDWVKKGYGWNEDEIGKRLKKNKGASDEY